MKATPLSLLRVIYLVGASVMFVCSGKVGSATAAIESSEKAMDAVKRQKNEVVAASSKPANVIRLFSCAFCDDVIIACFHCS